MALDKPWKSTYEIFSINIDFSAASRGPLGSRRAAHAGVKKGYPFKNGYFTVIDLCSVKTQLLQIGADMLFIITSTSDKRFNGVNIDDLEWSWIFKIGGFSVFCDFAARHI